MVPNAIAIFGPNQQITKSGDQHFKYRTNADVFYLTGIDQEETFLILYPDSPIEALKEVLFVRETSESLAIWEGARHSKSMASALSGIDNVCWHHEFDATYKKLMKYADACYLNTNENDRASVHANDSELVFVKSIQSLFPLHSYHRAAPILHYIRSIKSDWEIEIMKNAISITKESFLAILPTVKVGMKEYEIEAELSKQIIARGANGFSFEPIIAGGGNACVLHYITNNQLIKDGDLILIDFGADYGNYAADMTRVIPANGRFNKRQKEIYEAVLLVKNEATKLLTPGRTLDAYNQESSLIMQDTLLRLGLITQQDIKDQQKTWPAYKNYFPHGTGHFLGIDVHDVGFRYKPLAPGMVITCEPGIYIQKEGIGIRLENDILITSDKPIDLMADIPIEVAAIEELMNP